jgi:hypothetical protein
VIDPMRRLGRFGNKLAMELTSPCNLAKDGRSERSIEASLGRSVLSRHGPCARAPTATAHLGHCNSVMGHHSRFAFLVVFYNDSSDFHWLFRSIPGNAGPSAKLGHEPAAQGQGAHFSTPGMTYVRALPVSWRQAHWDS